VAAPDCVTREEEEYVRLANSGALHRCEGRTACRRRKS
jgi:hypothetical protein